MLGVVEMQDVNAVARKLAKHDDWECKFRVASKVGVSSKLGLLKEFEAGCVELKPTIEVTDDSPIDTVIAARPSTLDVVSVQVHCHFVAVMTCIERYGTRKLMSASK